MAVAHPSSQAVSSFVHPPAGLLPWLAALKAPLQGSCSLKKRVFQIGPPTISPPPKFVAIVLDISSSKKCHPY